MHNLAYISLGSNIGEKAEKLRDAVKLLDQNEKICITKHSSFYSTAPVGYLEQDDFVNAVIEVHTELEPEALLDACQKIEQVLKRERIIHWGPRTIDLDVLYYDGIEIDTDRLKVPHPRMHERAFVMVPLSEINPDLMIGNRSVREWCGEMADQMIRKMTDEKW